MSLFWLEVLLVVTWSAVLITTMLNVALIPRLRPVTGERTFVSAAVGHSCPTASSATRSESAAGKERPGAADRNVRSPLVSIVVPARNEERTIEQTLRGLLAQTYAPLEVIVVDDRSTDSTAAILGRMAAENPHLTVIQGAELPAGWLGKPWALHQGSCRANGDLLLFVDADVQYAAETVSTLVERLVIREMAMVSILPRFEMRGFWEHIGITGLPTFGFMVIPVWLANHTTIAGIGIGGGPGNLVRRDAFEEIGGYEALRDAVIDDIGMARQIRARGGRTEVVIADTLASIRMYHGLREIVDGFTKNVFAAFGRSYFLAVLAILLLGFFDFAPYVLAMHGDAPAIVAVALISIARLLMFARLRYRLDNAVFGFPISVGLWGWILVRSMWMTGFHGEMRWRGRAYDGKWTRFGSGR